MSTWNDFKTFAFVPTGSYMTWAPGGIKLGLLIAAVIEFMVIAFALFLVITWLKRRRLAG